ncbi:substrate-binding domain-containing protein [Flavobacterium sp. MFBS3-15]|uniref:PstS family phosphate ABC transporter substrate-binding protein n=1 Tax=Flavobacterium sp. MFBS3-15 TaxID=2989816 RepID=UPI00223580E4|nr:substrate-binding domain-containing protein [Flavobacterium sp. MFBS3-15]MCW4470059.1 substrate-binding domain-containing protein [Flavobacterium sp. MFBS3-15]
MKKTITIALSAVVLAGVLNSCGSKEKDTDTNADGTAKIEGTITMSGAFALYPLANVWAEEFRKEYPDVKFNISGGGAGKGMTDMLNGAADIAMYSKEISKVETDQGAYGFAVTKDAVIPTIAANNPVLAQLKAEGMKREELSAIFLKDAKQNWKGSSEKVNVYTRSDAAGAAETWAKYLGGKAQEELKGVAVFGDPGLADAVKKDKNGIGYNNVIYAYDINSGKKYPGLEVLPIDVNGNGKIDAEENFYETLGDLTKAIADGRYPSPPARELFLVTKGKPASPAVKAFLNWVLTKGQDFVVSNGYILLEKDNVQKQIQKL